MKIDVVVEGDGLLFRFESDFIPRNGETISDPRTKETFVVVQVDHLMHTRADISRWVYLITLTVNKL